MKWERKTVMGPLMGLMHQMTKILLQNTRVPDAEGAIFIKLLWSDIRDTNVESQHPTHARCVEESLREEMS